MDSSQPIPVPTIFGDDIAGFLTWSNCWIFTTYSYEPSYWMLLKREGFSGGLVSDSSELDGLTNQMSREDLATLYRIHYKTNPDHFFTISLREDIDDLILSSQIKVFKLNRDLFQRLTDANDVLYSSRQTISLLGSDAVTEKRNELAEELGYDISTRWLTKDKADKLHWDRGLITREAYELYDIGAEIVDTAVDFVVSLYQIGKAIIIITGNTFKVVGEFALHIATSDIEGIKNDLISVGIWVGDTIDSAAKLVNLAKQGLEIFNQLQNDPQSRDLVIDYFSSLYESIPYRDSRTIGVRIVAEVGIEVLLAIATAGAANVARRAGQAGVGVARIGSAAERIGPFTKQAIELLSDLAKRLHSKNISSEKLPPPKNPEIPEHAKNKNLDGDNKDSTMPHENIELNKPNYLDSTTPSGSTIHHGKQSTAIGNDDATISNFQQATDTGNGHNVIVHGSRPDYDIEGGMFFVDGNPTNSQQIIDALASNPNYQAGSPICLASCWSGSNGTAQNVANALNTTVTAPTRPVRFNQSAGQWEQMSDALMMRRHPDLIDIKPEMKIFKPDNN